MIKCQECGKEFLRLKQHLRVKHDMSLSSYRWKHPNALTVDPEYSKRMKKVNEHYNSAKNLTPIKKGEKRALKKENKE